jgi:hypothetical protein
MPLRGEVLCKQSDQSRAKGTKDSPTEKTIVQAALAANTSLLALLAKNFQAA